VHLLPTPAGLEIRWRLDGVLASLGVYPPGTSANVITRLKILADLLTYRNDTPQEGRIRGEAGVEMRVSTLPSLYGEKGVVRLFRSSERYLRSANCWRKHPAPCSSQGQPAAAKPPRSMLVCANW
jgi:type II secretory ATPase GspE/PulE/Tfp pilus assembly ATPase PilB-like protein